MQALVAIFVDAGYFFAQGSYAKAGQTKKRHEIELNAEAFMNALQDSVMTSLPDDAQLLRIYWYDGAKDGRCTIEQLRIGALPHVKLRVGRINSQGQQKGVDTLIVRDLMVLSQERSINYAVVISGDEDLREGIEYAQDRGVMVDVLGIRGQGGTSQSQELVREADRSLDLAASNLDHLTIIATPPPAPSTPLPMSIPSEDQLISDEARAFADKWLGTATSTDIRDLLAAHPVIPSDLDWGILVAVEKKLERSLRQDQTVRKMARKEFWKRIREASRDQGVTKA